LSQLAQRMGMVKRGAELDLARAAVYFVQWWREEGGLISASPALQAGAFLTPESTRCLVRGWGFDFQWHLGPNDLPSNIDGEAIMVQEKMEECIDEYLRNAERDGMEDVSATQMKKRQIIEEKARRKLKHTRR
jgi:mitochondrial GTPase 1